MDIHKESRDRSIIRKMRPITNKGQQLINEKGEIQVRRRESISINKIQFEEGETLEEGMGNDKIDYSLKFGKFYLQSMEHINKQKEQLV